MSAPQGDPRYARLRHEMEQSGHARKCVVIAGALLFGISYEDLLAQLDARAGRANPRSGYYDQEWYPVFRELAHACGKELRSAGGSRVRRYAKTARTFTPEVARRFSPNGLLCTTQHVSAVIDGRIVDWADGRRKRVIDYLCLI